MPEPDCLLVRFLPRRRDSLGLVRSDNLRVVLIHLAGDAEQGEDD
jgi:hypothetical protein